MGNIQIALYLSDRNQNKSQNTSATKSNRNESLYFKVKIV